MIYYTTMEKENMELARAMEQYLEELNNMPSEQAKQISRRNLIEAGIFNEDGTLSDRYAYSKKVLEGG